MKSEDLIQKVKKIPKEGLQQAYVCGEYDDDMFKAMDVLRKAGFRVSSAPVSGLAGPELTYDRQTYCGLDEIKEFARHYKKTGKIWLPEGRYW